MQTVNVERRFLTAADPLKAIGGDWAQDAFAIVYGITEVIVTPFAKLTDCASVLGLRVYDARSEWTLEFDGRQFMGWRVFESESGEACHPLPGQTLCFGQVEAIDNGKVQVREDRVRPYSLPVDAFQDKTVDVKHHVYTRHIDYIAWDADGAAYTYAHRFTGFANQPMGANTRKG